MSTTSTANITIPGRFTLDGQAITVKFTSPDPALIAAIDTPGGTFPAGDPTIDSLSADVSGKTVQLGDSQGSISFSLTAGATYNLQVIGDPVAVTKTLNANSNIASGIDLKTGTAPTDRFMLLQLTYNVGGTAKGTAALGVGLSANFGATSSLKGDWDVIHRFGAQSALDVLNATFSAWRLPRQISNPSQLNPGTWLVAEINGSLALNLGVQAGYNFSWLKQLQGNLTGDIGVKVSAATSASLRFSANGNYALALSRPDGSNKLRLAIYKLTKNGWTFALNASAGVQGQLPPALASSTDPTDLVKAIFGVQANQLINDLKTVQKVAAGGNLTDQAADYLVQLGQQKLGGAVNLVDAFNKGVDDAQNFISQLGTLGQRTTSQIVSLLSPGQQNALNDLKTALTDVKNAAADPTQIASILTQQLKGVAFFQTSVGQWLTALLQDAGTASPLSALKDSSILTNIGKAASTTLEVINGGDLQNLVDYAEKKLILQNIPSLNNIDTWLKSKVAAFLGKAVPTVVQQDLTNVQTKVNDLFKAATNYWTETIKAVQKQYEATFVATYQNSDSSSAMIDVVFDFDANPNLEPLLRDAINGDFTKLLIDPSIVGVTLNSGVLTHGFSRQTHVELTLPFFDAGTTAAATVASSMTVKHDGGTRLLAYTVDAKDEVTSFITGRSMRDSQMTLVMNPTVTAGIQKAPDFQASFGYSLRAAYAKTTTRQLVNILTPLVPAYSLPLPASDIETWVADFEKVTNTTATGNIGTSLTALDVAMGSSLPKVWLSAPADANSPVYSALSVQVQTRLRQLISRLYFGQIKSYGNLGAAYPVMVYASLRAINSFDINSDDPPKISNISGKGIYWDWHNEGHLEALVFDPVTRKALSNNLQLANELLRSIGHGDASFYAANQIGAVTSTALKKLTATSVLPEFLGGLIIFEANFINAIVAAATELATFSASAAKKPAQALTALSNFSGKTVHNFNGGLGKELFVPHELETLGSALFTEVTLALAEALQIVAPQDVSPSALFSVSVVQPTVPLADLLANKFTAAQVIVEQKLASPLASFAQTGTLVH